MNSCLKYTFLLLMVSFLNNCREPYDLNEIETNQKVLVVEGEITNKPGPYVIRLSEAIPFTSTVPVYIQEAEVFVKDNSGNIYPFRERDLGIYVSDSGFIGLIGETYTLFIKTSDGSEFKSSPCTIGPQSLIDNLYGSTERYLKYPKGSRLIEDTYSNGFHAFADLSFLPGQKINTRLEIIISLNAVYSETHYITQPAYDIQYLAFDSLGEVTRLDRVPLGSYDTVGSYTLSWDVHFNSVGNNLPILKTNSDYIQGSTVKRIPLCYAETSEGYVSISPSSGYTYDGTMTLLLKAYTISNESYNYFYNLTKQLNGNNSFFEALPVQLKGNIKCLTDTTKTVFGIFQANSIVEKYISVTATEMGYTWEPANGFPEVTSDSTYNEK